MITLPPELLTQLNMVVLECDSEGNYKLVSPATTWFLEVWGPIGGRFVQLNGKSPFLDNFLLDATTHWQIKQTTPIRSGVFMEQPALDTPYPLEAEAFYCDGISIMVITNLGNRFFENQKILQIARENLLTKEQLEIEVSKRTREIRERESEVAGRLIYASGFRDEETGAHIRRIGLYSAEIAKALAWSPLEVDDILIAAPMHDLGKIGIPDSILKKPGKLTPDEFEVMKDHPRIGAEILAGSNIPMVKMAAEIAANHHECWDGCGYPEGRRGDAIPLSARIVAIVDVYDALVHKRVYKEAINEDEAIQIMRQRVGIQFDPDLYDLFEARLDVMRAIRHQVKDE